MGYVVAAWGNRSADAVVASLDAALEETVVSVPVDGRRP